VIRAPVIILGAPRSGTTLLFETLARSSHLWSLGDESHDVFEGPYHPRLRGWESNVLTAADLDPRTAAQVCRAFERHAQPGTVRRLKQDRRDAREHGGAPGRLAYRLARLAAAWQRAVHTSIRLLEKTPKNCLRIPFLRALFPDASFVVLRRDGRATISSLIDCWRAGGRYGTYRLPEPVRIPGREDAGWCFLLPPGWRRLLGAPLEEVCAAQWLAAVEAIGAELPALRAAGRVHEVAYEELVARPREVLEGLLAFLGLPLEPELLPGRGLRVVNALTPPDPAKWRRNAAAIARILPRITEAQHALGYEA
jgi:hypothetical protein